MADELRRVLREERATGSRPANDAEYLPVALAAAQASVAPATIYLERRRARAAKRG